MKKQFLLTLAALSLVTLHSLRAQDEHATVTVPVRTLMDLSEKVKALEETLKTQTKIPIGTIVAYFGKNTVPEGWMACDGSTIPTEYKELRVLVGDKVPDLKDKFLRMYSNPKDMWQGGGSDAHTHAFTTEPYAGGEKKGSDKNWGDTPWARGPNPASRHSHTGTTENGSSIPPFVSVAYIIKSK